MKKKQILTPVILLAVCLLTGCAKTATDEEAFGFTANPQTPQPMAVVELEDQEVPLADLPVFLSMPEAPGTVIAAENDALIDYSNAREGYVMARYAAAGEKALRVQVQGPTELYTYVLPDGEWAAFPLGEGSGTYQVTVLESRGGKKYDILVCAEVQAEITDALAPFLRPTENVDYEHAEKAVEKAAELTAEAETPLEKAKAIYEFVTKYIADDGSESAGGERPVLDSVLEAGMGSYYDRAALMAGMLRSQGVPCRISVGYTGQGRHTEVDIQTEESGWSDGLMLYDGEEWQWTEEGDSAAAGSRYTVKFVY